MTLDLGAIEARAKKITWPQRSWQLGTVELIKTDIPALIARIRELEKLVDGAAKTFDAPFHRV